MEIYNITNLNLYHYAGNNPVKYTDPDGAFLHISISAALGGFIGGAFSAFTQWRNTGTIDWKQVAGAAAGGAVSGALMAATAGVSAGMQVAAGALAAGAGYATNALVTGQEVTAEGAVYSMMCGAMGVMVGQLLNMAVSSVLNAVTNTSAQSTALTSYYPSNGGALGEAERYTLMPGDKIDRFGSNSGKFFLLQVPL